MPENYKDAYTDLKIEYDSAIELIHYYTQKIDDLKGQNKELADEIKRLRHEVEWLEDEINKLIRKER